MSYPNFCSYCGCDFDKMIGRHRERHRNEYKGEKKTCSFLF